MRDRGAALRGGTSRGPRAVVFALLLALAAACTGGGEGTGPAPSEDVPGPIVVASGRDVTGQNGVRRRLIDAWNERQEKEGGEYRARLVELPGSADEQRGQLLGALQSGSAAYDVVNLDVTWVPEFAAAGLVRPLPASLVDDDVIDSVAGTARWDGEVYAAPFNSDVGLLYYRRDHLAEAGMTSTDLADVTDWKDLEGLIDVLDEQKIAGYEKGWTTQLDAYEGRTVNAVEAFASTADDFALTDDEGRYTATVEELTRGVAELGRRTGRPYLLPEAAESDEAESLTDFTDGRTTFLRHWPWVYRTLHQDFSAEQIGVTALPGRAVLGGQNLAVTAGSRRAAKATDLIEFLTGEESERCLLDAGFAATRVSAYEKDTVRCPVATAGTPSAAPSGERPDRMPRDAAERPAYARTVLLPALRAAVHRPRTPLYGAFTQTFTAGLGPLLGADPPDDAELAKSLDKALRRALPD
ncbi:extracellular solute-binding protein [Streptomyces sp. CRN 30]|uniref:extracellular solute-binding protein n=1 Tax=Streptomyces sp. CRN 30 TaxID=3075613 RepID=UPI002A7FDF95|nr:extracellular solute-binding protein [Streptomyces sp. CRN 30]